MQRLSVEQLVTVLKKIVTNMEVGEEINSQHVRNKNPELAAIRGTEITVALQYLAGRGYLELNGSKNYGQKGCFLNFRKVKLSGTR
jgi:predicted transcriptional regulator